LGTTTLTSRVTLPKNGARLMLPFDRCKALRAWLYLIGSRNWLGAFNVLSSSLSVSRWITAPLLSLISRFILLSRPFLRHYMQAGHVQIAMTAARQWDHIQRQPQHREGQHSGRPDQATADQVIGHLAAQMIRALVSFAVRST
jgi:hypothetical protein